MVSIHDLLQEVVDKNATDLHLTVGLPPMFRIDQRLIASTYEVLTPETAKELIYSLITVEQRRKLEADKEVDFAFGIEQVSRFRGNAFIERTKTACALRRIPFKIPSTRELGLPPVLEEFTERSRGLVLITGPTGSGKSTTLAAMIDKVNSERSCHIITVEDPIEYIHQHKRAVIHQREVGQDTNSFATALKYSLRQDPDVILVGEMRDLETISAALTAAETGHLVLATLHTDSCTESINRIIDVFPPYQQRQVRSQLALTIEGVVTQRLLPRASGRGLVLGLEIMSATPAIRALIRDDRVHEIYGMLQAGQKYGMCTMNMSLHNLIQRELITWPRALLVSPNSEELKRMKSNA